SKRVLLGPTPFAAWRTTSWSRDKSPQRWVKRRPTLQFGRTRYDDDVGDQLPRPHRVSRRSTLRFRSGQPDAESGMAASIRHGRVAAVDPREVSESGVFDRNRPGLASSRSRGLVPPRGGADVSPRAARLRGSPTPGAPSCAAPPV